MAQFDPSTESVEDVLKELEGADSAERQRILAEEQRGKKRVTILREYDVDPNARIDSSGRTLYPWEVDPADQVVAVPVEETDEEREHREFQAELDAEAAAARAAANGGDEQGGADAPGTGIAPAVDSGADAL